MMMMRFQFRFLTDRSIENEIERSSWKRKSDGSMEGEVERKSRVRETVLNNHFRVKSCLDLGKVRREIVDRIEG